MNVFDASSCVGVIVGAVGGSWMGFECFGVAGGALGIPVGAVIGAFGLAQLVHAAFLIGIFLEAGPAAVWEELWPGHGSGSDRTAPPARSSPNEPRRE